VVKKLNLKKLMKLIRFFLIRLNVSNMINLVKALRVLEDKALGVLKVSIFLIFPLNNKGDLILEKVALRIFFLEFLVEMLDQLEKDNVDRISKLI